MGFRFRKSFKVAPGVRVNVGKKSVGVSVGGKGARVSVNSSGRVTKSASIPGTGISYVKSENLKGRKNNISRTEDYTSDDSVSTPNSIAVSTPSPSQNPKNSNNHRVLQVIGILLIVWGLILTASEPVFGLIWTAIGCFCLHKRAAKIYADEKPFYRRRWQLVVVVLYLFFAFLAVMPSSTISEISIDGSTPQSLAVPDSKKIIYTYSPEDADDEVSCTSSNPDIASVEVTSADDGKIICVVTPLAAGETTISCKASFVSASDVKLTITDPAAEQAEQERIAAEKAEQERAAAEKAEQERIAAEKAEQERIAAEKAEQERIAAEEAARQEEATAARQPSGQTVYVTPSGKRYHFDPDCGGKNSRPIDISEVGSRTPCQKCAS